MTTINIPVKVNASSQLLCAWGGPVSTVCWLLGFMLLAGFIPPLDPNDSALEIQKYYQDNTNMIRFGMWVTMLGGALMGPFWGAVYIQMKRIEGYYSPLANVQLGLGMIVILLFVMPCFSLATAAFRPERDAELIMLMNDAGWLPFVAGFHCTFVQLFVIGYCILQDKEQKVFPRWLAFVNFAVAMLFLPAGGAIFFKTGPFAWNGLLAFWLAVVDFCGWYLLLFWYVRKAILKQAAEAGSDAA